MSSLKRCSNCKGRQTIVGLGMIEKKCESCDGVGWEEVADDEIAYLNEQHSEVEAEVEVKEKDMPVKKKKKPK